MTTFKVLAIHTAKITELTFGKKTFPSALLKQPIEKGMFLSYTGLAEDEQTPEHHGGTEKALCLYPYDHYSFWDGWMEMRDGAALFGENITTEGLHEQNTHIGDRFEFGEAIIEVTEPRQPCFKIAARYHKPELIVRMRESGYTGFYFRVLKEGTVKPGDVLTCVERDPARVSVHEVNQLLFSSAPRASQYDRVLEAKALSKTLRPKLIQKRNQL
ncbi:MOSC domain-containing protein [Jeotgalibacillus haloalkalitolerans]|uniref:MOSC domain-containing protein n=1 Tax=Jeotgalibacillus haloalkalitolerans TaxID=3104292 RepID=A0ABU5KQ17_9BACL|nr:MOSC domain-containing protein [Jeotgalibacillus sp. HH7-29]MDZ5713346.1 MOSC domain-containing protein [Jeotgalibacillus sp. HH7-29]